MARPSIRLELAHTAQLLQHLSVGGIFLPSCSLRLDEDCDLVIVGSSGELTLAARVVYVAPTGGAGLEIVGFHAGIKQQIAALMRVHAEPEVEPDGSSVPALDLGDAADADHTHDEAPADAEDHAGDDDAKERKGLALNAQARLRGLTVVQQIKVATHGEASERMVLERMYGNNVWEALLRNPRLTAPEVSRIARMGTLPRVLLEVIVNNASWLQIPEVRRALLGNPRLGTDQIVRVLRLLPKHELKMAATTTAYPFAVRDAAKKLSRSEG